MDALPMKEETSCDFKSTNGCMHSCGHDMHTAMLLGAAKLLKQNQNQIEGTIKLVFQPDEEGFTGAKKMLEAGVLENPKVDAAHGDACSLRFSFKRCLMWAWNKYCRMQSL